MKINESLSRRLQAEASFPPYNCFCNARSALGRLQPGAKYVEGYAVDRSGLGCPHAWVELCGQILEVTTEPGRMQYFPVLKLARRKLEAIVSKLGRAEAPLMLHHPGAAGVELWRLLGAQRAAKAKAKRFLLTEPGSI